MSLLLTWNMQGGRGNMESKWTALGISIGSPSEYALPESPSIIFLQECSDVPVAVTPPGWGNVPGDPPGVTVLLRNFGTRSRPNYYFIAHHHWGTVQNRVSYAVLVSTGDQPVDYSANVVVLNPVPSVVGTRPIIGITLGNATYYSMHAPSGVPIKFSNQYIDGMISQAANIGDYVIGGDFNCEPENVVVNHGVLNTSGYTTCGDAELDYFASSDQATSNTQLESVGLAGLLSDHRAVYALC